MTELERLNRLENQTQTIIDILEQIAKDADLLGTNIMNQLHYMQAQHKPKENATSILEGFPAELAEQLTAKIEADYWIIKPRQFLGGDNFSKVMSIIREIGGEYVSAGKDSHFRVLVKVTKQ